MTSQAFSLLLITADSQVSETVAETLRADQSLTLLSPVTFAEAAANVPTTRPDLILLDMAGADLITAVSTHFPHLPIVVIVEKAAQTNIPDGQDYIFREDLQNPLLSRILHNNILLAQQETNKNLNRQQQELAKSLSAVGTRLNATLDYDWLLDYILEQIEVFLPYDVAAIQLLDGDYSRIVRLRVPERTPLFDWIVQKAGTMSLPIHDTRNLQTIIASRQPLLIPDVDEYEGWIHFQHKSHIRSWIGAPLIVHDTIIGIISLDKIETNYYTEEHISVFVTFATQAATALHNARIYKENRRKIEELNALHAIARASSDAVDVDDLLTRCTQIVSEQLYPDSFGFILDNGDGTISAHHAVHNRLPVIHPDKLPIGTGVVGQVILTGEVKRVSDVRNEATYEEIVAHTHSELCVPLRVEGEIIGAINAESIFYDAFTEADEQFLITLSQQVSTGIERIRLIQAERKRHQEAAVLREATRSLTASLDLEQVLTNILNRLQEVVPNESASIMLLQGENLVIAAYRGSHVLPNIVGSTWPATNALLMQVRQSKRPLCLQDAQENPHFDNKNTAYKIRGWICLPLIAHDQILGLLTVDHTEVGAYGDVETRLAQSFANYAANAIENARLYMSEQEARKTAEIMREANATLAQSLDIDIILRVLLEYIHILIPFDNANIWFIQEDFAQLYFPQDLEKWNNDNELADLRVYIKGNPLFEEIFITQQGLRIADVQKDGRWSAIAVNNPTQDLPRSWMGIPIIAGGEFLGFLTSDKAYPDFFTKEHLQFAENLVGHAAVLIQNAQLLQETRQRTAELEAIVTLSASLRETVEVEALLRIILEKVLPLVKGIYGGIYLIEPDTGDMVIRSTMPYKPELIGLRQSVHDGISGYVARTGRIYIAPDIRNEPLLKIAPEESLLLNTLRTAINLPLRAQERIVGVLHLNLDRIHTFTDMEVKLLTAVSEIAGTAIDRAMVLDTLEHRVAIRTQELAKANDRLTELDRLKTKFVSDISHELRTPITNLSLYLDLLEKGKPERRSQYTTILRRQVTRLTTMLEDIMNISRLDMGKIKLNLVALDLNEVVQEVVTGFENQTNDTVVFLTDYQQDIPLIFGDKKQIAQILMNLLNNAVSYTQDGSIRIATSWNPAQKQVCIDLEDTGVGIPPLELAHVFERFYRASNVSQSTLPGTGLGLSLVKELVDMHHGKIEITSELNKGTTISLSLPVVPRLSTAA